MAAFEKKKNIYTSPEMQPVLFYAQKLVCTSTDSGIEDWIDDGDIFTFEESTNF